MGTGTESAVVQLDWPLSPFQTHAMDGSCYKIRLKLNATDKMFTKFVVMKYKGYYFSAHLYSEGAGLSRPLRKVPSISAASEPMGNTAASEL